jgi:hypothetical protein
MKTIVSCCAHRTGGVLLFFAGRGFGSHCGGALARCEGVDSATDQRPRSLAAIIGFRWSILDVLPESYRLPVHFRQKP